jgi:hypothetical protein
VKFKRQTAARPQRVGIHCQLKNTPEEINEPCGDAAQQSVSGGDTNGIEQQSDKRKTPKKSIDNAG